jgi:membrane associated rhomboid family serine protease
MRPPESWQSARATLSIAAILSLCWLVLFATGLQERAVAAGGLVPARLGATTGHAIAAAIVTPLTASLIHGGFGHLALNLVILLFCGRAVETILGTRGLVILYLAGIYAAAAAQFAAGPHSAVPVVGASGAISALIGAYAMMFGRNRVKVANPVAARWLHALWLAAAWIVLNLMMSLLFRLMAEPGAHAVDIAVASHIGGFLAGMALHKPLLLWKWRGA